MRTARSVSAIRLFRPGRLRRLYCPGGWNSGCADPVPPPAHPSGEARWHADRCRRPPIRHDEAEAFLVVEELDLAFDHRAGGSVVVAIAAMAAAAAAETVAAAEAVAAAEPVAAAETVAAPEAIAAAEIAARAAWRLGRGLVSTLWTVTTCRPRWESARSQTMVAPCGTSLCPAPPTPRHDRRRRRHFSA